MKKHGTNCKQQERRRIYGERGSDSEDLQENGKTECADAAAAVQHTDQSGGNRGGGCMNKRLAVIWRIWEEIEEYPLQDLVEVLVYLRKRKDK